MSAEQLGPLMRLWGLTTAQLPPTTATADELAPFLISLLQEAVPFINSVAPKDDAGRSGRNTKLWKSKGSKSYSESSAKVELYERVVPASELEIVTARAYDDANPATHRAKVASETWVCRRSVHADSATTGTASWAEFLDCFKDRHAETEDTFTPAIVGAREAMTWDCGGVEADEGGETWGRFTLKVEEMKHKIGAPLNDRVFAVLQMTCAAVAAPAKSEFLVVSVPVMDFGKVAQAHYAKEKGVVLGAYVSVERIRKLPGVDGDIEWLTATASDARGVLPMWVQTLAVPGQIAKDVSLFLGWIAKERTGGTHVSSVEPNKSEDTEGRQGVQTEVPAASEGAA